MTSSERMERQEKEQEEGRGTDPGGERGVINNGAKL